MKAYKFLAEGRVGRFSDVHWPEGEWIEAGGPLEDCRTGIHACLLSQLPDWIDDELWEIELDGEVALHEAMVVAERGRLLRRVERWDAATAQAFADDCAWRARGYAIAALRGSGLTAAAEDLLATVELDEAQRRAVAILGQTEGADAELTAFAADAVSLARGERPESWTSASTALKAPVATPGALAANLGFVVAHAAGREAVARAGGSESAYDAGFAAERALQLEWLVERLELDPAG